MNEEVLYVFAGEQGPPGAPGATGPAGPPLEEDMLYAERVDFVGDTLIYRGAALPGTTDSQALWRIRKLVLGVDGDVTTTWAGGTSAFDKVWNDRAALSYS